MARIGLAPEILDDFDRIIEHLAQFDASDVPGWIAEILDAIQILARNPRIGRPVNGGKRELIIGQDSYGYVALYRFVPNIDTVFVLAVRSQRERDYRRRP